jgi:ABC-type uncharacterized transport system involved in gliding motility auxiliary subunit
MQQFFALLRKDLKGYFDQPTGYILLVIFVGVNSYLFFRSAINAEEASLRPLGDFLHLLLLGVFVSASTMRLVAEEQRDGTIELLFTHPIRVLTVVVIKFLAGVAFVGLGVLLTVGIPLAMSTAGDLDSGAVVAQYVGTFLLVGAFVAIGMFTSSLTRNQIVAFILSFTTFVVLLMIGLEFVTLALPRQIAVLFQDLSLTTHFSDLSRGVLNLRDILYFVTLISLFISATFMVVRGKSVSHRSPRYRNLQVGVASLVVISVLVGWFGGSLGIKWDLTEQELFTLSSASKDVLGDLDDIVTIKFFSSKNPGVRAAPITRDLKDFLQDVADASDGKVRLVQRYPDVDEDARIEAEQVYVRPIEVTDQSEGELNVKTEYLGFAIRYANRQFSVPVIVSLSGLEYTVMSRIYRMALKEPKTIGFFLNQHEETPGPALNTLRVQLIQDHRTTSVELDEDGFIDLTGIDVLILPDPTKFIPRTALEQIDNFLADGGDAMFLLDPIIIPDPSQMIGYTNVFSVADFVAKYGVQVNRDVVFDMRQNQVLSVPSNFGTVPRRFPYFPRVNTSENKISGGVPSIVMPWGSSIEETAVTGASIEVEITRLLETTQFAGLDTEHLNLSLDSPRLLDVADEELDTRLMAAAITGTRCPTANPGCEKNPSKVFRIIVVADADWANDGMVAQYQEHLPMAVNWIDWLTQDDALATIRSKQATVRPLIFDSTRHRNLVQYSNVAGAPLIIMVLGLVRYLMRRRITRKVYSSE